MKIIAIDPGIKGGFAVTEDAEWGVVRAEAFYSGCNARLSQLRTALAEHDPVLAILEDVGFHRAGNSAQASATLAREVGRIESALSCFDVPIYWVTPKQWRNFGPYAEIPKSIKAVAGPILTPAEARRINSAQDRAQKAAIAEVSRRLFPGTKNITLATADALALYWFGITDPAAKAAIAVQSAKREATA